MGARGTRRIEAFIGIPVFDELYYRLLLARIKDVTGRNPLEALREDAAGMVAAHSKEIETAIRKLLALPHSPFFLSNVKRCKSDVRLWTFDFGRLTL